MPARDHGSCIYQNKWPVQDDKYDYHDSLHAHLIGKRPISIYFFTKTAEILLCSLVNFYHQYADRHMNLKFV